MVSPTFSMSVRAEALLARGQPPGRRRLLAAEVRLERLHARGGEQHRRVVAGRHERSRRHAPVLALLEERQEALADLAPPVMASGSLGAPGRAFCRRIARALDKACNLRPVLGGLQRPLEVSGRNPCNSCATPTGRQSSRRCPVLLAEQLVGEARAAPRARGMAHARARGRWRLGWRCSSSPRSRSPCCSRPSASPSRSLLVGLVGSATPLISQVRFEFGDWLRRRPSSSYSCRSCSWPASLRAAARGRWRRCCRCCPSIVNGSWHRERCGHLPQRLLVRDRPGARARLRSPPASPTLARRPASTSLAFGAQLGCDLGWTIAARPAPRPDAATATVVAGVHRHRSASTPSSRRSRS